MVSGGGGEGEMGRERIDADPREPPGWKGAARDGTEEEAAAAKRMRRLGGILGKPEKNPAAMRRCTY